MNNDISYLIENVKYNFRVAVFIYNKEYCLLTKSHLEDYFALLGGRVKLNENTKDTAIREIYEETGIKINKSKLKLYNIIENFFSFKNNKFHEILFIYKYKLNNLQNYNKINISDKDDTRIEMINLQNLKDVIVKPDKIKEFTISKKFEHYINYGE